jgi:hypothetical protein
MNVQIPLNAHINTKDEYIIHNIESENNDALNKKNTIVFQSTLSPLYIKAENKVMTTSGHTFTVSNIQLVDEKNQSYAVDNSLVVDESYDLTKWHSGKVVDAIIVSDLIYAVYENNSSVDFVIFDTDGNETSSDTYTYENDDLYVKGKILKGANPEFVLARIKSDSVTITKGNTDYTLNTTVGSDLYAYQANGYIFIGFDDKDVRKRFTFVFDSQLTLLRQFWGWGCIGDNGYVTGEPIPIAVLSTTPSPTLDNVYDQDYPSTANVFRYFLPALPTNVYNPAQDNIRYSFLENGIGYLQSQNSDAVSDADWITSNSVLKNDSSYNYGSDSAGWIWGNISHTHTAYSWVSGLDLNEFRYERPYSKVYPLIVVASFTDNEENDDIFFEGDERYYYEGSTTFSLVDFGDGLGNLEWNKPETASIENGCNPFPHRYATFNKAESKGKYWDYGKGWSRSYYKKFTFVYYSPTTTQSSSKRTLKSTRTSIVSWGMANPDGYKVRIERLSPYTVDNASYSSIELEPSDTSPYLRGDKYYKVYYGSSETSFTYARFHKFCPKMFDDGLIPTEMIGADNMPNHVVLNKIPFNVKITDNLYDQYYQGNYMSTSLHSLLTSASVSQNQASSCWWNDNYYSVFSNGLLVKVVKNGTVKLTKVADYIYKTNTLKGNNLLIDSVQSINFQRGFIPYNDEEIITINELTGFSLPGDNQDTDGNDTYYSASGYNVQMNDMTERGTSYLLPAFQFPLTIKSEEVENFSFQLLDNKKELTKPLLYNQFSYKDNVVDHYYIHSLSSTSVKYQTGKKMQSTNNNDEEAWFGVKTYDIDKEDMVWWITSEIQIFPLGIASPITGINYLSSNIDMTDDYSVRLYRTKNVTFPVYNPETEVYKSSNIFTIYGNNYSFDGQSIYYLGSGDTTDQSSFACYALGMKFLANSGTEAFFYSPFEKRLYLFTGSVTLQIADSLAREGGIIDSVYSSCEQILYLLTSEGKVIAKSQEDMCLIETVDPNEYHLESTETGAILTGDNKYIKYRLYQTDETEWLPLEYETEYIGNNDKLFKVSAVELTLFKGSGNTIKGSIDFQCMNDKLIANSSREFQVSKTDWDTSQLVKVKLTPGNNVMKAFKFGINTDDYIHIANVNIVIEEVSNNTNAQVRR